ncbi:MAG TPA: DUF1707 domain-containing protein [Arachnia sp.]|nr:DUF1707 domain-containing protein [Arachnia sp.]
MSELRPSFQERDRYLDLLSTAYADGRLDESEFEARSNAVLAAVTHRDAMAQFQGLPQPNIVPVAPTYPRPQQGPPQAFQPLPEVYRGHSSGGVGRRVLLGVGAAVVGLGVLGVISFSGVMMSDSGTGVMDPMMPEPDWAGGALDLDPMFFEGWAETSALLRDHGLDSLAELRITTDEIGGVGSQARAPGEITTFSRLGMGPIEMSASASGEGLSLAELDMVDGMVQEALDAAGLNLSGAVSEVLLVWTETGDPTVRVTAIDGPESGSIQIDANGGTIDYQPMGPR